MNDAPSAGAQLGQVQVAVDPAERVRGPGHSGSAPAQRHLPVPPPLDVLAVVPADLDHGLDGVRGAERACQRGRRARAQHGEGLGHASRSEAAAPGWVRSSSRASACSPASALSAGSAW
jgi:hypothetical protein